MATSKILKELQDQAQAFRGHCIRFDLCDRIEFQTWMTINLTKDQLASLIDGEVTRQAIFEVYLNDQY